MGHKAAETTWNINKLVAPGTPKEHRVQWWFKKFFKGEESLDDEEHSGRLLEVDNDPLRASSKHILLKLHEKLHKNSTSTILQLFSIWSKLERWENSVSASWVDCKSKNCDFEVSSSLTVHNKSFLNQIVMYHEKQILCDNQQWPAQWLDQE